MSLDADHCREFIHLKLLQIKYSVPSFLPQFSVEIRKHYILFYSKGHGSIYLQCCDGRNSLYG